MAKCKICGEPSKNDLFSDVTGEPVCSLCKIRYIGGLPTTSERIVLVRERLGLADGEYLKQDRTAVANAILVRRRR